MVNTRQKCGVAGYAELLIPCSNCNSCAEHNYCLDGIVPGKLTHAYIAEWKCEMCKHFVGNEGSLSLRIAQSAKDVENALLPDQEHRSYRSIVAKTLEVDAGKILAVSAPSNNSSARVEKVEVCEKVSCVSRAEKVGSMVVSRRSRSVFDEDQFDEMDECSSKEILFDGVGEGHKSVKRRKLILSDADEFCEGIQSCDIGRPPSIGHVVPQVVVPADQSSLPNNSDVCDEILLELPEVAPVLQHIWRGSFYVGDKEYGPYTAHCSARATDKVVKAAMMLPAAISALKLSRLDAWPKSFEVLPPTNDNIGLFIFPDGAGAKFVYDSLLDDFVSKDLILRAILDEFELLIFPSSILPAACREFQGRLYLWGGFRSKQLPNLCSPLHSLPANSEKEDGSGSFPNLGREGQASIGSDACPSTCLELKNGTESVANSGRENVMSSVTNSEREYHCPSPYRKLKDSMKSIANSGWEDGMSTVMNSENEDQASIGSGVCRSPYCKLKDGTESVANSENEDQASICSDICPSPYRGDVFRLGDHDCGLARSPWRRQ